jgi:iron complex outermembrane recepter protein
VAKQQRPLAVGAEGMIMGSVFWRNAYLISSAVALSLPMTTTVAQEAKVEGGLDEIVVTARRREESAQETPVSLSVLTADDLYTAGIKEIRDLTAAVPGVNMTSSGGTNNTVFSIRGRSRSVIGNAQPSVATYVNEVPLSIWGASIPTYDLSSIQVLKGPQGTLFGRNTTTGAVLVSTAQPTHDFGGYVTTTFGRYSWQQYEGAANLPLLPGKVALRVSGQFARRDGYTKNMSNPSQDLDDMHRDNYRASLLLEPIDGLKNVTIFERNDADETGAGVLFYQYTPGQIVDTVPYYNGQLSAIIPAPLPCNGSPTCDTSVIAQRQADAGPRKAWTDLDLFFKGKLTSLSNTTTYELGPVTLKNIFGSRKVYFHNVSDIDGTELPQINADNLVDTKQTTEEFQVSGDAFDDTLSYLVGYFYSSAKPNGLQRLEIQQFAITGTPINAPLQPIPELSFMNGALGAGDYYRDKSNAYFGQASYKLSGLSEALSKFSLDFGVRRTKDKQSVCSVGFQPLALPAVSENQCQAGAGTSSSVEFSKTTYTFGINYAATDDVFLYGVTRKGYRAGGINTPVLGGTLASFQNYAPETVQDYELGVKSEWSFGEVEGRFNLAVFQSKFKDVQAGIGVPPSSGVNDPGPDGDFNRANDPANNLFYANVGEATVEGVEGEVVFSPLTGLEISASGAYLDKKIDELVGGLTVDEDAVDSFTFLGSPDYSYNFGVSYTWPLAAAGEVRLSGKYFRISEVTFGTVEAPSWERADFRVDWNDVAGTGVDAGVFVTNAFDEEAVIAPASSTEFLGVNSVLYAEPRIYGVQLRYQFGE